MGIFNYQLFGKYPIFQNFIKFFSQFSHSYDYKIEKPDVKDNTTDLVKDENDINFDQINVEVILNLFTEKNDYMEGRRSPLIENWASKSLASSWLDFISRAQICHLYWSITSIYIASTYSPIVKFSLGICIPTRVLVGRTKDETGAPMKGKEWG